MPHERGSGANWNNARKGGLQSMPIGLGQNAPGLSAAGRTLPTSPLRAAQGAQRGGKAAPKAQARATGGGAGSDGSEDNLMAARKGTTHFSGVNAFNKAVNKLKMIRAAVPRRHCPCQPF